jgi:hypothetical protein
VASSVPQPADGPGLGLAQQSQDPPGEPGAAQPWPARVGPVGQSAGALSMVAVDPATHGTGVIADRSAIWDGGHPCWESTIMTSRVAMRWGPWTRRSRSQGQPAGQAGLAYTLVWVIAKGAAG